VKPLWLWLNDERAEVRDASGLWITDVVDELYGMMG